MVIRHCGLSQRDVLRDHASDGKMRAGWRKNSGAFQKVRWREQDDSKRGGSNETWEEEVRGASEQPQFWLQFRAFEERISMVLAAGGWDVHGDPHKLRQGPKLCDVEAANSTDTR